MRGLEGKTVIVTGGGGGIGYMIGSTGDAESAANGAFWGMSRWKPSLGRVRFIIVIDK